VIDETEPALDGMNGYPDVDEETLPTQIGDDSELALLEEREEAFRELRAEGHTDEEILEMERRSAIKVFD